MVLRARKDAEAMYQLQLRKDRPISVASLRSAIFWEHRHLAMPTIVSTPALDEELEFELFSDTSDGWKSGLDKLLKIYHTGFGVYQMHNMFGPIRRCEFTLWNIRIDEAWVTLFFRLESKPMETRDGEHFDREVSQLAIVDPWPKDRQVRRQLIETRLPSILGQGCIDLKSSVIETFPMEDIKDAWSTGHLAYAVSREIFRRLRVLIHRRGYLNDHENADADTDFLWDGFEEHYDIGGYRQSLMAACAHQTIEKSSYHVRLSLEVPSEKSKHEPLDLHDVPLGYQHSPDEVYTKHHYTLRDVAVEIPEDMRPEEKAKTDIAQLRLQDSESEDEPGSESDSESEEDEPNPKSSALEQPAMEDRHPCDVPIPSCEPMDILYEAAKQETTVEILRESTPNDSLEVAAYTPSNELANNESLSQAPLQLRFTNGESISTGGGSMKRSRSVDEPDVDEASKRQRVEDASEFMFLDRQSYRSPSPDTTSKRHLDDAEDSLAKRLKEDFE
ncbi:hypothetical protein F5Y05DRAFT_387596 [Hypoxylon sp. FL0543]|nr:hypothetical protein F5Y05DRAFT_387596 [Hypoxylon sp. FL0543]